MGFINWGVWKKKEDRRKESVAWKVCFFLCVFFCSFLGSIFADCTVLAEEWEEESKLPDTTVLAEELVEESKLPDTTCEISVEYWGKQLLSEERVLYDEILKNAKKGSFASFEIQFQMEHIWDRDEEGIAAYVSNMVARAYSAFTYDYPLYRPKNYSYRYAVNGNQLKIEMTFEPFYEAFFQDLNEAMEAIDALELQIKEAYGEKWKEKETLNENTIVMDFSESEDSEAFLLLETIYEKVIETITYSFQTDSITEEINGMDEEVFCVSAVMLEQFQHHGVCSAYSGLFQILCQDFGLECIQVSNDQVGVNSAHSYNYVYLQDSWYLIDCTWGDEEDAGINWDSFLCGGKVSLDKRIPSGCLANAYIEDAFRVPTLEDTFYYQIPKMQFYNLEEETIVYDACRDEERERKIVVGCFPYSSSFMELLYHTISGTMVLEEGSKIEAGKQNTYEFRVMADETCRILLELSDRYYREPVEKCILVKRYPELLFENQILTLTGVTPYFTFDAVPNIVPLTYVFQNYESTARFHISCENYEAAKEKEDSFSMECVVYEEQISELLPKSFLREQEKRSQGAPVAMVVCEEWTETMRKGLMEVKLKGNYSQIYAVGMSQKGKTKEIGTVSVTYDELLDETSVFVPFETGTVVLYERAWEAPKINILLFLILGVVMILSIVLVWIHIKNRTKK